MVAAPTRTETVSIPMQKLSKQETRSRSQHRCPSENVPIQRDYVQGPNFNHYAISNLQGQSNLGYKQEPNPCYRDPPLQYSYFHGPNGPPPPPPPPGPPPPGPPSNDPFSPHNVSGSMVDNMNLLPLAFTEDLDPEEILPIKQYRWVYPDTFQGGT